MTPPNPVQLQCLLMVINHRKYFAALTSPFLVNGHSALLGVENRGMSIMTSTLSTSAGQNSGLGLKSDYDKEGSH